MRPTQLTLKTERAACCVQRFRSLVEVNAKASKLERLPRQALAIDDAAVAEQQGSGKARVSAVCARLQRQNAQMEVVCGRLLRECSAAMAATELGVTGVRSQQLVQSFSLVDDPHNHADVRQVMFLRRVEAEEWGATKRRSAQDEAVGLVEERVSEPTAQAGNERAKGAAAAEAPKAVEAEDDFQRCARWTFDS